MIELTHAGTTIALPNDLHWRDEYDWHPVTQRGEYTLAGSLVVESAAKQAGRPITLQGADDYGWMRREQLDQVTAWAAVPGRVMQIQLRGVARDVAFDHERQAITARPLVEYSDPIDDDRYIVELRFIEV